MTARDARGRFVSADEAAATRLLEAAVREARELMRRGLYRTDAATAAALLVGRTRVERDHIYLAERAMFHAAHGADLLLRRAS